MSATTAAKRHFTINLLKWHYEENNRNLPWKNEKDPYKIWLSEVILQQTRAEQGRPYYDKFIHQYPEVSLLANAPEEEVFLLWQGLGYYNRCRNLLITARYISESLGGIFPATYDDIRALKGVGDYTSAAIASFAFNLPYAVVDGNVYRVLSRYFGIDLPIDSNSGKMHFKELAADLLDKNDPADYNQAIMDFGAAVCKPKNPNCAICNLSVKCIAYKQDMIALLPVKSKKLTVKNRHFHYLILQVDDLIYLQQRVSKDIWQSLHEFFLIESDEPFNSNNEVWQSIAPHIKNIGGSVFFNSQKLTHQKITADFYEVKLKSIPLQLQGGIWVEKHLLKNYAFPKTILSFFDRKKYF